MYIVTSTDILRRFKSIDIFQIDLGLNLKGPVNMNPGKEEKKIKVRDEFNKRYHMLNGRYINKFGHIGTLTFYEDLSLPKDEIHIYKEKDIIEIKFTKEDYKIEPRKYLSDLLETIDGKKQQTEKDNKKESNVVYTNMPQEIVKPDISMPKDQYIEALVKNRQNEWNNIK